MYINCVQYTGYLVLWTWLLFDPEYLKTPTSWDSHDFLYQGDEGTRESPETLVLSNALAQTTAIEQYTSYYQ